MFFFIGGIQPKTALVDKQARPCPSCGHLKVYLKRVDQYISLFFIPIFPVKRGLPFLICENCHTIFDERGSETDAGYTEEERRCHHCGRSIDLDFTFCPSCGRIIRRRK